MATYGGRNPDDVVVVVVVVERQHVGCMVVDWQYLYSRRMCCQRYVGNSFFLVAATPVSRHDRTVIVTGSSPPSAFARDLARFRVVDLLAVL
jgi:hypothetical protein